MKTVLDGLSPTARTDWRSKRCKVKSR